ncbi:MAG: tetratricopeptide repeat protein [Tepidisphaeraceae bacterium]|jgi:tetratricopeptide (TPR) repeat protein
MTVQEAFNAAVGHHNARRFHEAEVIYRQILSQQANHHPSLHLLGTLGHQVGQHAQAMELITKAISLSPNQPEYYASLGAVLADSGKPDQAISAYRHAIALKPTLVGAYNNLGNVLASTGQHDAAIQCYRQAMLLQSNFPDPFYNLANLYRSLGRFDDAIGLYRTALVLRPDWPAALNNLGLALKESGHAEDAVECFQQVLQRHPDYVEGVNNLADALCEMRAFDASLAASRRALQLRPNLPEAHNNMGNALTCQGRYDEAVAAFRNALAQRPDYVEAYSNLGNAYYGKGEIDQAIAMYRTALALRPAHESAHWNLGVMLALRGDLEAAWPEFEKGWFSQRFARERSFTRPLWEGEDLRGRLEPSRPTRIVLHSEQGFGDAIHFARYVPQVVERGGEVILACQSELRRLFSGLANVREWVSPREPLPAYDLHCPLMLLGKAFKTTLENIPGRTPYLRAEPELSAKWREKMPQDGRRKIGLIWSGKENPDPFRSMTLEHLAPLAKVEGIWLCSLQTGEPAKQTDAGPPGLEVAQWTDELTDFADSAALIDNLDLIITVDTASAHLAGAMGKAAWVLLKSVPDWRWMLGRSDSPWYPSLRLFRQKRAGDWSGVMDEVIEALRAV